MALRSLLRFIPIITQFVTERLSFTLAHSCSSGKSYRSIIRAKTSSKLDVFKRGRSYARSVRWILETTSHQGALLEAARNIPALQDIKSTRTIFEGPDTAILQRVSQYTGNLLSLSKKSQTSSSLLSHPDDSLAYSRLVSLYRGSLARYLTQQSPQRASKVILNEAVVYGRALCHALITSTGAQEAFEHLSQHLGDFASLAWMDGVDGELRLLLMCTLNHPRFWLYPELVENSFHSIDITTLPMYIVGISIVSLARSASDRTTWVNRLVHWSLSRDDSSPRVLGVAAKALFHNGRSDVKSMLNDFWSAYPRCVYISKLNFLQSLILSKSGDQYLFYVLEALQWYPSGLEIVPDCIEAYSALVKALRVEISDLDTTRDDFYPLDIQARRRKIRANVKEKLGHQILKALEDILIKVTDLIKSPPRHGENIGISFPHPTFGENHLLQDIKSASPFIHEILHAINIGLEDYRWGHAATPSGLAFWKVGEVVENNSESLRILLEIMSKTAEETDQYSSLFRDSPSVAPGIIAALNSNVAEVRANALLLIGRKAQQWFEDPFINESFLIHKFDEYLIWHLKSGDTPHRSIKSLVAKLESKLEWRTRLYKAFHELALSSKYDSSEGDPTDLVGLSLDIWRALSVSPVGPEMDAIMARFNWYSYEMVSKVTEYVLYRVRSLKLGGAYDAELTKNAGISETLRVYDKHLSDAQTARETPAVQALLQAVQQLEELIDPNTGHNKGSRSH
ncbi:hypothetical protein FRC02_011470 [Tulasnella sp. 418]|nr:hypothetical protein FRC02_011470 [Tulasnella sp. 418]